MNRDVTGRMAYCTIASANYLARVQVFVDSLKHCQPDADIFVLMCESEEVCRRIREETGFAFLSPAEVCPRDWQIMAFQYDIIEMNTALKPFLLDALLDRGYAGAFYFDPDIAVYSGLAELETALACHDVVLTPHACHPVPDDGCTPAMADYLRAGQFNLGFVGIAGSANGRAMLDWWKQVCIDRCIFDPGYRFFVDQFWAAAFASFAERLCVLRHPGANVAYWNLFQREVAKAQDNTWRVDGQPLLFFHFSGLSTEDLSKVSRYQNRVSAPPGSALYQLLKSYVDAMGRQGWKVYSGEPYSFACFADGEAISPASRRNYLLLSSLDKQRLGDPFHARRQIQGIVRVSMHGTQRSYLARVRFERYWRYIQLIGQEFTEKLRTRGLLATIRLALRLLARQLARRIVPGR